LAFDSSGQPGSIVPFPANDANAGPDIFLFDFAGTNSYSRRRLVSINRDGTATGNNISTNLVMSPDADWILFRSQATDLTADALSGQYFQLFAHHVPSSSTHLVSYAGRRPDGGLSSSVDFPEPVTNAVFSANSRYVAFSGLSTKRTYLHDLLHYTTNVTSLRTNYVFTNDTVITNVVEVTNAVPLTPRVICSNCVNPSLGGDGRLLAYQTHTNGLSFSDIQVKDLETGETTLISANRFGTGGGNGHSTAPQISPSGRYVVFTSLASDLVANDANGAWDVFVHDRWAQTTMLVSLNAEGTASANRSSPIAFLDPDGRSVVFQTFANDVAGADYNLTRDIFVVRLAAADSDDDGLDDDWEVTYFDDLSRDGTGDFDGDGVTDADEFRYGTDPTNLSTVVRVLSVTTLGDTTGYARLLWAAVPNRLYRVQYKDSATDPAWVDLPGDIPVYNYTMGVAFVPMHGQPQRFYRVVLVP